MQEQIKSTEWKCFFRTFFQICVAFCGLFFNDHLTLIAFSKAVLILFLTEDYYLQDINCSCFSLL